MIPYQKQFLFVGLIMILISCKIPAQEKKTDSNKSLCTENLEAFKVLEDSVFIKNPILKISCCYRVDDEKLENELMSKIEIPKEKLDINIEVSGYYPCKYTQKDNIIHVELYYISLNERLYTGKIKKTDGNKIVLDFEHLVRIENSGAEKEQFFKMVYDIIVPNNKMKYEIWFKE
jgi:hypothetical protein